MQLITFVHYLCIHQNWPKVTQCDNSLKPNCNSWMISFTLSVFSFSDEGWSSPKSVPHKTYRSYLARPKQGAGRPQPGIRKYHLSAATQVPSLLTTGCRRVPLGLWKSVSDTWKDELPSQRCTAPRGHLNLLCGRMRWSRTTVWAHHPAGQATQNCRHVCIFNYNWFSVLETWDFMTWQADSVLPPMHLIKVGMMQLKGI